MWQKVMQESLIPGCSDLDLDCNPWVKLSLSGAELAPNSGEPAAYTNQQVSSWQQMVVSWICN